MVYGIFSASSFIEHQASLIVILCESEKNSSHIIITHLWFCNYGCHCHLHYCMNEFVGWSLFHDKDDKCGKCGMEEKDKEGCCKDEHKHFKLKTDHQKAGVAQFMNLVTAPALSEPVLILVFILCYVLLKTFPPVMHHLILATTGCMFSIAFS